METEIFNDIFGIEAPDLKDEIIVFIEDRLRSNNSKMGLTCLKEMEHYFKKYPHLFNVMMDAESNYLFSYDRKQVIDLFKGREPKFVMGFFERGLKNLGFHVMQTTNKGKTAKIWKLKGEIEYFEFNSRRLENLSKKRVRDEEKRKDPDLVLFNYGRKL